MPTKDKVKIAAQKKRYSEKYPEKIIAAHKKYYLDNKAAIDAKHNVKVDCPCGGKYTMKHKAAHFKSKKHQRHIPVEI